MPPSLEYWHALDMCAVAASTTSTPVTVLAQSSFYQNELGHRLGQSSLVTPVRLPAAPVHCVVWAEPEQASSSQVLAQLQQQMPPGSLLACISSNWLARRLPDWQTSPPPANQPTGAWRLRTLLKQTGYRLTELHGFHGPVSIAWGVAGQLLGQLQHDALADRCAFQMRMTYAAQGWQALLAPVSVLIAEKV